ncbi:unnamed protein product [Calypogeia fissa]
MAGKGKGLEGPRSVGARWRTRAFFSIIFQPAGLGWAVPEWRPRGRNRVGTATVMRRSLTDFELSPVPVAGPLGGAPVGHISSLIPIRNEQEDESEEEEKGKGKTKRGGGDGEASARRQTRGQQGDGEESVRRRRSFFFANRVCREGLECSRRSKKGCRDSGATTGQGTWTRPSSSNGRS